VPGTQIGGGGFGGMAGLAGGAGSPVAAGTYTVHATIAGQSLSTTLQVVTPE
jgi:hypothetical protein